MRRRKTLSMLGLDPQSALLSIAFVLLPAHTRRAQSLTFFNNYFIPGADYVVGGVGLDGAGVDGIATGTIAVAGVPGDAQGVGAGLYTHGSSKDGAGAGGAGATLQGGALC